MNDRRRRRRGEVCRCRRRRRRRLKEEELEWDENDEDQEGKSDCAVRGNFSKIHKIPSSAYVTTCKQILYR